ncbi:serine/threonine protein kinase [Rhodalgimonas zhirmunskyi]|uniref:Serine/threonine protein kinase n=1 Tax=Rhodalgimonas zhirmunskyi TaxID=2964767 RepID=A0AAJ1UF02_9RHOB|nr:serine/threonine protein kinase [Rhodoalgimonas zhirmunskyi]MDQ2094857.1 serine/threonine protein kinase [Rhodoalgimonas zhirmunskyi]
MAQTTITFVPETVHKRDVFSETISGHLAEDPARKVVLRKLDGVPWWARPIALYLARREVRGLRAVSGIEGVPELLRVDREGLLRSWSEGTPLQLARPSEAEYYRDAKRLLCEMRRRGVTHNDIAKPQNWLRAPDGRAAVIDFQLASVHRRKGKLYRVMAREDLRHLLKQKRRYAPALLTPMERRMLERKALPTRVWMATAKPLYNFVTRKLMNWSDGEGTEDRIERDGPAVRKALAGQGEVALFTYTLPARGVGVYAFVESDLSAPALRALVPESKAELVQGVSALPRRADGSVREDALTLVAANRLDELEVMMARDDALAEVLRPIIRERQNLTDRG